MPTLDQFRNPAPPLADLQPKRRLMPNEGSLYWQMINLNVGGVLMVESESKDAAVNVQRRALSRTRYPKLMEDWEFSTEYVVGVGAGGTVYHLTRIKRTG